MIKMHPTYRSYGIIMLQIYCLTMRMNHLFVLFYCNRIRGAKKGPDPGWDPHPQQSEQGHIFMDLGLIHLIKERVSVLKLLVLTFLLTVQSLLNQEHVHILKFLGGCLQGNHPQSCQWSSPNLRLTCASQSGIGDPSCFFESLYFSFQIYSFANNL
jgi:hypothetical protein